MHFPAVDSIAFGFSTYRKMLFEGAWAYTIWDISKRHLEDVVKNAVTAAHPGYVIDDADFIETPDGSYFLVEMEQGEREIYVKVTAEGEILP